MQCFSAPHPGKECVVSIAVFPDGTKQIIIDKTIETFFIIDIVHEASATASCKNSVGLELWELLYKNADQPVILKSSLSRMILEQDRPFLGLLPRRRVFCSPHVLPQNPV
jgi:hypothetical protein